MNLSDFFALPTPTVEGVQDHDGSYNISMGVQTMDVCKEASVCFFSSTNEGILCLSMKDLHGNRLDVRMHHSQALEFFAKGQVFLDAQPGATTCPQGTIQ